ncbi:MAG: hypothetical protein WC975_04450 [Phycisphaerae bacterium]
MGKCSFGNVVVNEVFQPKYPFGTDLEGRFLYLEDGPNRWLLAAFDFSYMFRHTSRAWRTRISEATGIPVSNIWVHELQNHSAPGALALDGQPCEKLVEISLPVIRDMIHRAQEAELSYVIADLGDRFSYNREQYIPELGTVTVWQGMQYDSTDGRAYTQDPSILLLGNWKPDLPAFKSPIYFDRPADPQGALLVFRSVKGDVLGTLTRFAAHAAIAGSGADLGNRMEHYRYHFCWPGYVRRTMEAHLGGIGMCVCGPCGNINPKNVTKVGYDHADAEARRIGEGIANACLDAWRKAPSSWEPIQMGHPASTHADLPLRDSIPRSRKELIPEEEFKKWQDNDWQEIHSVLIPQGAPPASIKRRLDEHQHQVVIRNILDRWVALSEEELQKRTMTVELEAVRLNDLILGGLPGESMTETCQWLRAQTIGSKLIMIDQVNGYCVYQTTTEQYNEGGYHYWCGCIARGAEALTRKKALELVQGA